MALITSDCAQVRARQDASGAGDLSLTAAATRGRHSSCEHGCMRDDYGKAGPFSVERLKMDLPFVTISCVQTSAQRSAGPLAVTHDCADPCTLLRHCLSPQFAAFHRGTAAKCRLTRRSVQEMAPVPQRSTSKPRHLPKQRQSLARSAPAHLGRVIHVDDRDRLQAPPHHSPPFQMWCVSLRNPSTSGQGGEEEVH